VYLLESDTWKLKWMMNSIHVSLQMAKNKITRALEGLEASITSAVMLHIREGPERKGKLQTGPNTLQIGPQEDYRKSNQGLRLHRTTPYRHHLG
jgi:hypothetical protein